MTNHSEIVSFHLLTSTRSPMTRAAFGLGSVALSSYFGMKAFQCGVSRLF